MFDFIKSVSNNSFKAGNKSSTSRSGGVDYSTTGGKIDDIKSKLDDYKAQIIAGTIKVPPRRDALTTSRPLRGPVGTIACRPGLPLS